MVNVTSGVGYSAAGVCAALAAGTGTFMYCFPQMTHNSVQPNLVLDTLRARGNTEQDRLCLAKWEKGVFDIAATGLYQLRFGKKGTAAAEQIYNSFDPTKEKKITFYVYPELAPGMSATHSLEPLLDQPVAPEPVDLLEGSELQDLFSRPGDKKLVLFMHGILSDHKIWDRGQIERVRDLGGIPICAKYYPSHSIKENGQMLYDLLNQVATVAGEEETGVTLHIEAHSLGCLITLSALAIAMREGNETVFDWIRSFIMLAPPLDGSPIAQDLSNLTLFNYILQGLTADDHVSMLTADLAKNPPDLIDSDSDGGTLTSSDVFEKLASKGVDLRIFLGNRDVMIRKLEPRDSLEADVKVTYVPVTHNALVKSEAPHEALLEKLSESA